MYFLTLFFLIPVSAYSFTYSDFETSIRETHSRTLEATLPLLPPDFRSRFILLHRSKSLQGGSPENPRVIFYNPQGTLFVSFNGEDSQKGGSHIEVLEAPLDRSPAFHSIQFGSDHPKFVHNPPICFTCHTQNGHPIFDPAPLWPGTYGSFEDRTHSLFPTREEQALDHFLSTYASHPRYSFLKMTRPISFDELNKRNLAFTRVLFSNQAKRVSDFIRTELSDVPLQAWSEMEPGKVFIRHLPEELQAKASRLFDSIQDDICRGMFISMARRMREEAGHTLNPLGFQTLPLTDLKDLEAIVRANTIASTYNQLDDFKAATNLTVDRESYVSNDGGKRLWHSIYSMLLNDQVPQSLFRGDSGLVSGDGVIYTLRSHAVCGTLNFHF